MDIKKYISSGILENYALGLVNEIERQEVEKNLLQYPEIKSELDKIEDAVERYAKHKGIQPPAGLLEVIMNNIRTEDNPPKIIQKNGVNKGWMIAAIIAALLFLLSLWFFVQKNNELGQNIQDNQQQNNLLQGECDTKEERLLAEINILRNTGGTIIAMNETPKFPGASTKVYWNEDKQTNYLDVINLPPPPTGKQYQLWAIVEGTPVDMGVFDISPTDTLVPAPFIANPAAFAITLEDLGGSPTPNLDELVVIGNT